MAYQEIIGADQNQADLPFGGQMQYGYGSRRFNVGQIGAKGSSLMLPTGSRMAFGYGSGEASGNTMEEGMGDRYQIGADVIDLQESREAFARNYDTLDAMVGAGTKGMEASKQKPGSEAKMIQTKRMANAGVKVAVKNGQATGISLTPQAVATLKRNLGTMSPMAMVSALKIIAYYEKTGASGGTHSQVGVDETTKAVGEAAINAVPGGGVVLSAIKIGASVFGSKTKQADKDRKAMQEKFLNDLGQMYYPLTAAFNAKGAAYDLSGYRPTGKDYTVAVFQFNGNDKDWTRVPKVVREYTLPDPSQNDAKMVQLLNWWQQWVMIGNSLIDVARKDTSKSRTLGSIAAEYFMAQGAYATDKNRAFNGKNEPVPTILGNVAREFYTRFAELYPDKGTSTPTQGDLAIVQKELTGKGGSTGGKELGTAIAVGQTTIGKGEQEARNDLSKQAASDNFFKNVWNKPAGKIGFGVAGAALLATAAYFVYKKFNR